MVIDENDNVYLSGNCLNPLFDFDISTTGLAFLDNATLGQVFLLKSNINGSFIWLKNLGYKAVGYGLLTKSLALDGAQNIYISDEFENTFDSDPSSSTNLISCLGAINNRNIFITKLQSDGSFDYSLSYGSSQSFNYFGDLIIDNSNAIISVGGLNATNPCDFDPSTNLYELSGGTNYIQKLAQCSINFSSISVTTCQTYNSPSGQSINASGIYTDTIPNAAGCDSIITINLTIQNPSTSTLDTISCTSYTAPSGIVHTTSGIFSDTIPNAAGCDSIITINLTITQPTTNSIAPNICSNSYTAPDGQVYSQSGIYTAIIPNAAGCDSTITINLTLTPAPIVNAGADQTICEGTTVTLSGTGATVYNWSDGIINAVAFQPPAGTINYIVTGTSANGCTDTDTVTVIVNPLPNVSFTGDNTTGCAPLSVSLMSDFQYAYCNWIIDGMSYSDSTCDMLNLNLNSGCHDVTLQQTTAEGCMNQLSMLDFICVQSTPTSGFIASPLVITDLNTPVTFTNTTVPTVLSAWDFDDGTGTYETNPVHYFQTNQEADTFHVILYSQMSFPDGCISSSSLYIYYIPSEVVPSDVSIPTGFSPNNDGANDTWTISGLENYPNATINVFNRWGQLLFEGGPSNPTWNGSYLGELLPTADYYYIIDLGEGSKYNGVVTLKQ
jgi:gliding motility-associated-like protein